MKPHRRGAPAPPSGVPLRGRGRPLPLVHGNPESLPCHPPRATTAPKRAVKGARQTSLGGRREAPTRGSRMISASSSLRTVNPSRVSCIVGAFDFADRRCTPRRRWTPPAASPENSSRYSLIPVRRAERVNSSRRYRLGGRCARGGDSRPTQSRPAAQEALGEHRQHSRRPDAPQQHARSQLSPTELRYRLPVLRQGPIARPLIHCVEARHEGEGGRILLACRAW